MEARPDSQRSVSFRLRGTARPRGSRRLLEQRFVADARALSWLRPQLLERSPEFVGLARLQQFLNADLGATQSTAPPRALVAQPRRCRSRTTLFRRAVVTKQAAPAKSFFATAALSRSMAFDNTTQSTNVVTLTVCSRSFSALQVALNEASMGCV